MIIRLLSPARLFPVTNVLSKQTVLSSTVRITRGMASSPTFPTYLVTPDELNEVLSKNATGQSRIVPLCASWFMPNDGRTGIQTFKEKRIRNARFFDVDAIKHKTSPYPHMLPSAEDFETAMSGLGIRNEDTVVVYDSHELGIFSAPRVAWTLKVFGHEQVHILNNFRIWVQQGLPTASGDPQGFDATDYKAAQRDPPLKVVSFEDMKRVALETAQGDLNGATVLDARSQGRFDGTAPEPRPGLPSGHMPRSINVPFTDVLDPTTKAFLSRGELRKVFDLKHIGNPATVITSCGTGVSAAVLDTALAEAGYQSERRLYDGSWTEWAQRATAEEGLIVTKES